MYSRACSGVISLPSGRCATLSHLTQQGLGSLPDAVAVKLGGPSAGKRAVRLFLEELAHDNGLCSSGTITMALAGDKLAWRGLVWLKGLS
jgi:hypothetical protein